MRRLKSLAGLAVLLPLLLSTAAPAPAADTYGIPACSLAPGAVNNSWQEFTSGGLSTGQQCPPQSATGEATKSTGMFVTDTLGGDAVPEGSIAGSRFIAAPGTEAVALQADRYLGAYGDNGWMPFIEADSSILETCSFNFPLDTCATGGPFGTGSLSGMIPVDNASTITVGIKCAAAGGCTSGATLHRAWAALYGAKVIVSEQAHPLIANLSGSLWGQSGYHHGTEAVALHASDLTGISKVTLSVDGSIITNASGVCDYTQTLPCQALAPALEIDTTRFPDGPHTITLDAYNAADNDTRLTESINVANQPPPPPSAILAIRQPDGAFLVSWTDPPDPTPISSAVYQLCPPAPSACAAAIDTGHDSPFTVGDPHASGWSVRVWLIDAAGHSEPGNAAPVTLDSSGHAPSITGGAEPPSSGELPSLRLTGRLRGSHLTLTGTVPHGLKGPVKLSYQALHGKHRSAHAARRVKVSHGRVRFTFILPHAALSASVLALNASASGARPAGVLIAVHHSRPRARAH